MTRAAALLLAACAADPRGKPRPVDSGADGAPGDSGGAAVGGVVVLAGGGAEGEIGDAGAWSARLYGALLRGGDVSGDGRVVVVVLSEDDDRPWIGDYFEWLGADAAEVWTAPRRSAAEDPGLVAALAAADAVFIKGGDQGVYYDLWAGTALQAGVAAVAARGGGLGGTSAGAMSLAALALAGGQDLVSADVLADACTPWLDDADGGTALKTDFFAAVPALVDTHFVERGRLGRLAGALARAVDEGQAVGPVGLGIDLATGLVVDGGRAEVVGAGSVTVLRTAGAGAPARSCGAPLGWAGLRLDRLIDGMALDVGAGWAPEPAGDPLRPPAGVWAAAPWSARAWAPEDEEAFGTVVERPPADFALRPGAAALRLEGAAAALDAHDPDRRAVNDEALIQALAGGGLALGLLAGGDSRLEAEGAALWVEAAGPTPEAALVVRVPAEGARGAVGPAGSAHGGGGLRPAALFGAELGVLAPGERMEAGAPMGQAPPLAARGSGGPERRRGPG